MIGGQSGRSTIVAMDGSRVGRSLRALRVRRGLRQQDVAERAGVSRSFVAKLEAGSISTVDVGRIERVCFVLGAELDLRVRWHGEGLDRLLDEAHARLVERVVLRLAAAAWECAVEVSFSEFGERGSIDVVAWHATTRSVLVVEVKSVIPDAQATIAPLDRKSRLAGKIARDRGWDPTTISRLLAVGENTTSRRRIAALDATFRVAFPVRGAAVARWIRRPDGAISGLLFLPDSSAGDLRRGIPGRQRVNRPPGR